MDEAKYFIISTDVLTENTCQSEGEYGSKEEAIKAMNKLQEDHITDSFMLCEILGKSALHSFYKSL